MNLFTCRGRLKIMKCPDIPAHIPRVDPATQPGNMPDRLKFPGKDNADTVGMNQ